MHVTCYEVTGVILTPSQMSARRWCFTLNNPTRDLDFSNLQHVRYASWQREQGSSGTTHFQGYIELRQPQRFSYFSSILAGAHFEQSRGSREQARDYTRKEESRTEGPWEYGNWSEGGSGTRNDLTAIQRKIQEGATEKEIGDEFFADYLRYGSGIRRYMALCSAVEPRNFKSKVTVLWGPPGTGKSHYATSRGVAFILTSSNYPWFDGYKGGDVLIDDFYGWMPFHKLLVLLDRYPAKVQIKGGIVEWAPKNIYITSNRLPESWYSDPNLDIRALNRRIEETIHLETVYNE